MMYKATQWEEKILIVKDTDPTQTVKGLTKPPI